MASLFFSYSHIDEGFRDELEKHLTMLKRQGLIDAWHDRRIKVGDPVDKAISVELERADIILLLVSSDFLASEYCYSIEMKRAIERHQNGQARAIPVILRPCDWQSAPFGRLVATPIDGKAVTKWNNRDEAWVDVVQAIKKVLPQPKDHLHAVHETSQVNPVRDIAGPRSSNLRIRKNFSEADRDRFLKTSFEYIARFFENSLEELKARNDDVESDFTRIDARQFSAAVYRQGKKISHCRIRLNSGSFGSGIAYSYDDADRGNSYNEMLSVGADDQTLFLSSMGFQRLSPSAHLSEEGAAELYWTIFMERMQ